MISPTVRKSSRMPRTIQASRGNETRTGTPRFLSNMKTFMTPVVAQVRVEDLRRGFANAIGGASTSPSPDYLRHQGWVVTAFGNALWQLLHALNLEKG
jgi:hypothetical protein